MSRALSPACIKIKDRIKELGQKRRVPIESLDLRFPENTLIGLEKIYSTYDHAEHDLLNELKTTSGPVRLFLQIAAQNIGLKGSLFDLLHDLSLKEVELRILHTSETSPLFSRDRLLSMGKNPDRIIATLRYVNESLRNLEMQPGTSLRHRIHRWPFIWRIYAFEKRLYLMPYYSDKDATKASPTIVFTKKESSMYNTFVEWFDFVWEQCSPREIRISDIITPATPSGTALFIQWKGLHVFGIPKRDLNINSDHLRFYGVGGKRLDPNESWEDCAIREGNEETTNVIEQLSSSHLTYFFRSNGTTEQLKVVNEPIVPRLILEKRKHSGHGIMAKSDDHYYLVAFDAAVSEKPKASGEIAALVYLNDYHLSLIKRRSDITIAELIEHGVIIEEQNDIEINRNRILVPHGTAAFLLRQIPE